MANLGRGLSGGLSGATAGMTIGGPLGAGIGGAIGLLGGLFSGGDSDAAELMEKAAKQYEGIIPPDLAREIVYRQYTQGGTLTPEQLSELPEEAQQAVLLRESPEMRQKQMAQLQALEQLATTGMGPQERFALEQSRLKAAQDAQARLSGLMQQYQQMGQGGGPAAMAAQAQALQQSAQNEYMTNLQAAAMAAENRKGAIQAALSGAGQLRQQDLGVEQSNVEALRQRQLFDIQNALARQRANAEMSQQANILNLQRQQSTIDKNIEQANQELYRRMYLAPQLMFANQMQLAGGRAGIYGEQAKYAQQQAQASAQNWSDLMGGVTGFAGAYDKRKQDNKRMDLDAAVKNLKWDPASESWVKRS